MTYYHVKGRVFVFIDAANIYHSQKTLGWRIDFIKLKHYFEKNASLGKILYYTAYGSKFSNQYKFLDFLEMKGYVVRKKKIKFIRDDQQERGGFHKGNLDVELTIDAVHHRDQFQTFILFSGDGDFEALLRYMHLYRKICVIFSTKKHVSVELLKSGKFVDLRKLKGEIELKGQ